MGITSREPGTVRGTARRQYFSRAFISVTVQRWTYGVRVLGYIGIL